MFYQDISAAGSGIVFGNVMHSFFSDSSDLPFAFGNESASLGDF
jgi:hypothetical protein